MRKLVASRSKAAQLGGITVQFVAACVGINQHVAANAQHTTVIGVLQSPLVWPDGVATTTRCLPITGVDNQHLVDYIVAIPVVIAKVHRVFNGQTSLGHHLSDPHIAARTTPIERIFAIISHVVV